LHIFWSDRITGQIKVKLLHYLGYWYGPYTLDPGSGQLRTIEAFGVAEFNNSLYLVFTDVTDGYKLNMARCATSVVCYNSNQFHDFGGGSYKKVVANIAVKGGPSAVAASKVNGLPWDEENLYVAWAYRSAQSIVTTRVGTDDDVKWNYYLPQSFPSNQTNEPLDIMVRPSAFERDCNGSPCERNYLYLAWVDTSSNSIFTSILQDADYAYWYTRSVDALVEARSGTGVSWLRGITSDSIGYNFTITDSTYGTRSIEGYGKY